ncbi:glutamate dehydrogenase (NADP(+)) [Salvia divinorum]|uniref:Glutamate dehydrogenase (NADP(+)) n=1 Tax=Salvia divinorum TaxID=28513 RepID=A0ABD1H6E3_SALDI
MHHHSQSSLLESEMVPLLLRDVLKGCDHETEFLQVIRGIVRSLERVHKGCPNYVDVMKKMLEPECAITFHISWVDDKNIKHVNRGFWICFDRALGPCRGGLHFHHLMNMSIAKFTFRNALSGFTIGGCSGGSNFDPRGKTDDQVRRFLCAISGFGKLSFQVLEKLFEFGSIPIYVSDSKGCLFDDNRFDSQKIELLKKIKADKRSLRHYSETYEHSMYTKDGKPWTVKCDVVFPCASHNEICSGDALALVNAGCILLVEGSSMSCTLDALEVLTSHRVLVAPSVAAGVGGVVVGQLLLKEQLLKCAFKDFQSMYNWLLNGAIIYAYKTLAESIEVQGVV